MIQSFLKWPGGKFRLLNDLVPIIGANNKYVEPFCGSSVVALNVSNHFNQVQINDVNHHVISLYRYLQTQYTDTFALIKEFFKLTGEEQYYKIRELFNNANRCDVWASSAFMYLNHFCFNGLVRYNKKGKFNVPYGKRSPKLPHQRMAQWHSVASSWQITNADYTKIIEYNSDKGTTIYCDPPYMLFGDKPGFTTYTKAGFNYDDHVQLKELAVSASKKGARVVISNTNTPEVLNLYQDAKDIFYCNVRRSISANGVYRGIAQEIIAVYE